MKDLKTVLNRLRSKNTSFFSLLFIAALLVSMTVLVSAVKNSQTTINKAASNNADLSFSTNSVQLNPQGSFITNVILNTNGTNVVGADTVVRFDQNKLNIIGIQPVGNSVLNVFAPITNTKTFDANTVISKANTSGTLEFSTLAYDLSATAPTGVFNGSVVLASLTFKSLAQSAGQTAIQFGYTSGSTTDSNVISLAGSKSVDVLNQPSSTILVNFVTPTPVVTPTASPVNTPTPAPTFTPVGTPSQTNPIVVDSLTLSSTNLTPNMLVTAATVVHAASPIQVQALTIAVRSSSGGQYDFTGASNNVTIGPSGYIFTPSGRTFPAGSYTGFVAYELNGTWYNLTPVVNFTSNIIVTPTPFPTPPSAQTNQLVLDSLTLNPSTAITSKTTVKATAVVHSTSPIQVQALTIAVRNTSNVGYDFTGARTNVTINPSGYTFTPDSRTFPQGNYIVFVAYKLNNKWYNLTPIVTFSNSTSSNIINNISDLFVNIRKALGL